MACFKTHLNYASVLIQVYLLRQDTQHGFREWHRKEDSKDPRTCSSVIFVVTRGNHWHFCFVIDWLILPCATTQMLQLFKIQMCMKTCTQCYTVYCCLLLINKSLCTKRIRVPLTTNSYLSMTGRALSKMPLESVIRQRILLICSNALAKRRLSRLCKLYGPRRLPFQVTPISTVTAAVSKPQLRDRQRGARLADAVASQRRVWVAPSFRWLLSTMKKSKGPTSWRPRCAQWRSVAALVTDMDASDNKVECVLDGVLFCWFLAKS